MRPRLRELVEQTFPIRYIGRPEASSPAEGSLGKHTAIQAAIVAAAFADVPPPDAGSSSKNGSARRKVASRTAGEHLAVTGE